ncbi:MAG: acyl-CoA dehydrogenase C-terminal domain-containing protein [Proteobacteria bacterium]|nr:acyl-CoA dehydrogenase C-terminal domain-containing protein [Pseudomonadota bacterium]
MDSGTDQRNEGNLGAVRKLHRHNFDRHRNCAAGRCRDTRNGGALYHRGILPRSKAGVRPDKSFFFAKLQTARFYADHILSNAKGLANTVANGHHAVLAFLDERYF